VKKGGRVPWVVNATETAYIADARKPKRQAKKLKTKSENLWEGALEHLTERMKTSLRSLTYCMYPASFIGKYVEVDHRMKEMIEQYISSKGLYRETQSAAVMWWEIPVR